MKKENALAAKIHDESGEGIAPSDLEKISVFSNAEAERLLELPKELRRQLERSVNMACLQGLNRYAVEQNLISREMYQKMETEFVMAAERERLSLE